MFFFDISSAAREHRTNKKNKKIFMFRNISEYPIKKFGFKTEELQNEIQIVLGK